MNNTIKKRIKELIVETLNIEEVGVNDIADDTLLFESEWALDSIDALELVVAIEKEYGFKIKNSQEVRKAMQSVNHLAEFIVANQRIG